MEAPNHALSIPSASSDLNIYELTVSKTANYMGDLFLRFICANLQNHASPQLLMTRGNIRSKVCSERAVVTAACCGHEAWLMVISLPELTAWCRGRTSLPTPSGKLKDFFDVVSHWQANSAGCARIITASGLKLKSAGSFRAHEHRTPPRCCGNSRESPHGPS